MIQPPSVIIASLRPMMWSFDQSPPVERLEGCRAFAHAPTRLWQRPRPPCWSHDPLARINAYRRSQTTNVPHLPCVDCSSSVACDLWPFASRPYNPSLRLLADCCTTPC